VSRPVLSIVIPTYNGRRLLETCLASVATHRPLAIPIEVIVSDDGSRDDTVAWLGAHHPHAQVVRREQNAGFCAAANAGIAAARGEFVQLLNNDTEVTTGWVEAGLRPFANPWVGSVAPLVLVRSDPTRVDSAGDRYAIFGWPSKRGHGQPAGRWATRPSESVFGASGSSAFYRSSALERVGAFDPAFGSYYEDVDLAFRLRWAGYTCMYAPDCRILHAISASYDHGRPELQRRMARNAEWLFWANLPLGWLAVALLPHIGFTVMQASWRTLRGRGHAFVAGKLDALRQAPSLRRRRSLRCQLAKTAVRRPHFPLTIVPFDDVRNHLGRPREARA
jgi:GT2 family glycosyltransferase